MPRAMARKRAFARRASEYIDSLVGAYSEQTVRVYRRELRVIGRDAEALSLPPKLADWGEREILALKSQWVARVMPNTVNLRFSVLHGFLSFHGNGIIAVMRSRRRLNLPPAKRGPVRDMEHAQRVALFAHAGSTMRMALVLGFGLGLRLGEIAGIRLSDVRGDQLLVWKAKGGRMRTAPLDELIMREIGLYTEGPRASLVQKVRARGWNGTDPGTLLVHCANGTLKPYTLSGLSCALRRVGERAGVRFSAHDMRRTYATELAERNVPIELIQELMGHQDPGTTRGYIRVRPRRLREAASGFQAAICTEADLSSGT